MALATFLAVISFALVQSSCYKNLRLRQKTYVLLLFFKFLPSNAVKKLLVKNVEHKVE